jgi:hypothetical protein
MDTDGLLTLNTCESQAGTAAWKYVLYYSGWRPRANACQWVIEVAFPLGGNCTLECRLPKDCLDTNIWSCCYWTSPMMLHENWDCSSWWPTEILYDNELHSRTVRELLAYHSADRWSIFYALIWYHCYFLGQDISYAIHEHEYKACLNVSTAQWDDVY